MEKSELIEMAKDAARVVLLDPALVCAVCEQESSWNPWAMRFEPGFLAHYVKPSLPEAPTTGEMARATSWGLMQVLGQVALEIGFSPREQLSGPFYSQLCDPTTGLEFGCKKLRKCFDVRGGDEYKALLMYNGGGNLNYPDQVKARMKHYW